MKVRNSEGYMDLVPHKAILNVKEKHFNKEMGRKVSLKKVLDKLSFDKISRKNVWHNYFIYTNQMNALYKMNKNK